MSKLFKFLEGAAAELLDFQTQDEKDRQDHIIHETPKPKELIVLEDGTVVYVGSRPDHRKKKK